MQRAPFAAIWMYARAALRTRLLTWAVLVVAIGLAAGVSIAAIAGGDRTITAFPRFVADARAFDAFMATDCKPACKPTEAQIRDLPGVADAVTVRTMQSFLTTADGRTIAPQDDECYSGAGATDLVFSPTGRFGTEFNVLAVKQGRVPNPAQPDEVAIAGDISRRTGARVGDKLTMTSVDCTHDEEEVYVPYPTRTLTIVGIVESPVEAHGDTGFYLSGVHATKALFDALTAGGVVPSGFTGIALAPGVDIDAFAEQAAERGFPPIPLRTADTARDIDRSVRPEAMTLWLIGVLSALAAAVVLGSALARQMLAERERLRTLRRLGFTSADALRSGLVIGTLVAFVSVALAIITAFALSMFTPIGEARRFDPNLGVGVDAAVLAIGVLATFLFVATVVAIATTRAATGSPRSVRRLSVTERLARSGRLRPSIGAGLRMAFERSPTSSALATPAGLVGLVVGVAGVVAALTFVAGLQHLRTTPRLVGLTFDTMISPDINEGEVERFVAAVEAAPSLDGYAVLSVFGQSEQPLLDAEVYTMGYPRNTGIGPAMLRGHEPENEHEVVLAPRLARNIGAEVGETLEFAHADGESAPVPYQVVGLGVMPIMDGRIDRGAAFTIEGLARVVPQSGPDLPVARFAPGAGPADLKRDLAAAGFDPERVDIEGGFDVEIFLQADLDAVNRAPLILCFLIALMALGVLLHTTIAAARSRRRELAIYRALGFRRAQILGAAITQSASLVVVALCFAMPLGIVGGLFAWNAYARSIGVVPETAIPGGVLALVAGACVMIGAIAVFPAAWRWSRVPAASLLRAE